jgi:hypothetical protein
LSKGVGPICGIIVDKPEYLNADDLMLNVEFVGKDD